MQSSTEDPEQATGIRRTEIVDGPGGPIEVKIPGNDASVWFDGWHRLVSGAQSRATTSLDPSHWWQAGGADVLVVQPEDDVVALPANANAIVEQLGDRATLDTIPRAGHALLPEQPEAVAAKVLGWLSKRFQGR